MNSQHRESAFRELREAHKLPGPCFSYLLPGRAGSAALQIPRRPPLAGSLEVWGSPKINIFCLFFCAPPGLSEKTGFSMSLFMLQQFQQRAWMGKAAISNQRDWKKP